MVSIAGNINLQFLNEALTWNESAINYTFIELDSDVLWKPVVYIPNGAAGKRYIGDFSLAIVARNGYLNLGTNEMFEFICPLNLR